jgi:hypothetical protein
MKPLGCAATRRKLQAFYDRELTVEDQIAVSAHLDWCAQCAALLADLEEVGDALRAAAPGRARAAVLSREDAAALNAAIVNRAKAEHDASFRITVRRMFDDMRLVYVGLSAAAASVVCLIVVLGMMRFGISERPDSLAAMVNILATPGSNENPVIVDARVMLPRALDAAFSTADEEAIDPHAQPDAVFTLSAVVTREGRIANLELLDSPGAPPNSDNVEELLDAVSRARFEPARREGLPVAVNMVWLVAHTTVRGSARHGIHAPATPVAKKRVAAFGTSKPRFMTA